MSSKEFVTLKDWMKCEAALCPVEIQHEGRLEDTHPPALLSCFTSPDVAQPALSSAKSQVSGVEEEGKRLGLWFLGGCVGSSWFFPLCLGWVNNKIVKIKEQKEKVVDYLFIIIFF